MKKNRNRWLAVLAALMLILAGCGASKDANYYVSSDTAAAATEMAVRNDEIAEDAKYEEMGEADVDEVEEGLGTKADEVENTGRKLIRQYDLTVETREYEKLVSYIQDSLNGTEGYIENSSLSGTSIDGGGCRSAYFVLRIPVSDAASFLEALGEQAHITYQSEQVQDVTLEYVDTQSRIESLRIEQKTLMEMLEQADTLENIIAIQSRLTEVRYQIESYESQLRTYDNQVEYTTISIDVYEVIRETSVNDGSFGQRLRDNFIDGFYGFGQDIQNVVIWLAGAVPVFLFIAVVILVVLLLLKKWKKNRRTDMIPKQRENSDFGIDSFANDGKGDEKEE